MWAYNFTSPLFFLFFESESLLTALAILSYPILHMCFAYPRSFHLSYILIQYNAFIQKNQNAIVRYEEKNNIKLKKIKKRMETFLNMKCKLYNILTIYVPFNHHIYD